MGKTSRFSLKDAGVLLLEPGNRRVDEALFGLQVTVNMVKQQRKGQPTARGRVLSRWRCVVRPAVESLRKALRDRVGFRAAASPTAVARCRSVSSTA